MFKNKQGLITYSPSDLTQFMESPFASWMDRYAIERPAEAPKPDANDPLMEVLQAHGDTHEKVFLSEFGAQGLTVVDISGATDKYAATREAMESGADVIFQACLKQQPFYGYADFLVKVSGISQLGDYHYEVWDTKLASSVRAYFVVQLCSYAEMLKCLQGVRPERIVVALGNGVQEHLRTDNYYYFYKSLKRAFLSYQERFNSTDLPDPADSYSWGRWGSYAEKILLERDHLFQVANITRGQIKKLSKAGIATIQQLADTTADRVANISPAVLQRLKSQARIQKASVGHETPHFEIIQHGPGVRQGLSLMPPGSPLDVFFDIEGYPLEQGGLEYLWGSTYLDENGSRQYNEYWAHNQRQEKQAFSNYINWVYDRWQQDPAMHIYHYANYEIAACRKLMVRYGVCEEKVDQLLRNEVFVDIYKVIKGGLLLGEPRYSIKNVEHLYRDRRDTDVGSGGESVVVYEQWRKSPDGDTWRNSKHLSDLRDYNIDDCNSTQELVVWLRNQKQINSISYLGKKAVEEKELSEEVSARTQLRDRLLARAEAERGNNNEAASLTENIAWMLEFHRREAKPVFWRLFDRLGLNPEELKDDLECMACCVRTEREPFRPAPRARNLAYEYSFDPNQEFKHPSSQSFYLVGEDNVKVKLLLEMSNLDAGLVVVQSREEPPQLITMVPDEYVNPNPIPHSIDAAGVGYEANELGQCAIIDYLARKEPRIKGHQSGSIVNSHDETERLNQIIEVIKNLDNSYLPIQGPPGSGKTYTGKHVIAELVKRGKKVGIASNSHKAINNLLLGVAAFTKQKNIPCHLACTKNTDPELEQFGVVITSNQDLFGNVEEGCVLGTTAWGFARDDMEGALDYLFIDEAGQVAVANLIAMSRSADNLVFMGDQMQLGQPAQGSHPADSGLSILDYLLHEQSTISDEKGVFLETTYRMHSAVNQFISDTVYEGKLLSAPENDRQVVQVPEGYKGPLCKEAGIVYVPVEHEGNTQASDEEVSTIRELANELLGRTFIDKEGQKNTVGWKDILFLAPYNHQVNKLKTGLGDHAKVGTVDKFQGQQAPIVFLSMCASNANESPRGMEFLFNKNRLNVAISRAQSIAIIVASPKLQYAQVAGVKQLELVNMFCSAIEAGTAQLGQYNALKKVVGES